MRIRILHRLSQLLLAHIAGKNALLVGKQEETAQQLAFLLAQLQRNGRIAGIQVRKQLLNQLHLSLGLLIATAGFLNTAFLALLHGRQVSQNQFSVDDFDIAHGVNRTQLMNNVIILKATHHLHNGIRLADIGKELIAEACTLCSALHQTGNIHKLNGSRNNALSLAYLRQHRQTLIRHFHHTHIRVNSAERIVCRLSLARPRNSIEKSGFAYIRKTYDTCL